MNFRKLVMTGAALLLVTPTFASTYFGGFEDARYGDYDYNDVVFSLSGNGLVLKTTDGKWYSNPNINSNGTPFWDNASFDGSKKNVGYCIYGGGNCGAGLAPGAQYLADQSSTGKTADDVYFSIARNGNVTADVYLEITAFTDVLGWYSIDTPWLIHNINPGGTTGTFSFNPNGDFGLVGRNGYSTYYSQNFFNGCDPDDSHFAFFAGTPTPEPGTMGAMAGGLILIGTLFRRRKSGAQK